MSQNKCLVRSVLTGIYRKLIIYLIGDTFLQVICRLKITYSVWMESYTSQSHEIKVNVIGLESRS